MSTQIEPLSIPALPWRGGSDRIDAVAEAHGSDGGRVPGGTPSKSATTVE